MQPDQRRLPAEGADHQRDMLLAAGRVAEGDHLAGRQVVERKLGSGDDGRGPALPQPSVIAGDSIATPVSASTSHSAGSRPASRARVSAALAQSGCSTGIASQRTDRARGRNRGPGRPARAPPRDRANRNAATSTGSASPAASRALPRPSAMARGPLSSSGALPLGSSRSSIAWLPVSTERTVSPPTRDRPSGPQRGDRAIERRAVAHTSSSRISGTWSDGRSQPRHGSSTR